MEEAITRQVQDAAETAAEAGNQVTAQYWWDQASTLYNITTPATIYRIFVQIWEWRMSPNKLPQGQLDHLLMLYNQLEAEGQTLPTLTRVMTLLATLPKDWQQLVTYQVLNQPAVANITWAVAMAAIGNHWDGLQAHKKHSQTKVNKLLAVQRKGPNQILQQQTVPYQGSLSKAPQKKGKGKAHTRGTRGKGQKVWKPRVNFLEQEAAFEHTAMLTEESCTALTLHMVSSIRPSGISTRVETKSSISSTGTNSMWPTFNAAMRLANRIGERSMGSVQAFETPMMTAPISQVVQQSIFPSALDLTPDYDADDLSCGYTKEEHYTTQVNDLIAGGCTYWPTKIKRAPTDVELTWDMMEDDDNLSLFGDNDDSIMDLVNAGNGYGDKYISSPLTKTLINCPLVRVCKINAAEAVVGKALLQKLTCNHTHNKCNCRILNHDWMLNSGATVHISPYMLDFIDYIPALVKGNVRTAKGPTDLVVEGSGTVLIQHVLHYKGKSHKELLQLQRVLYIPGVIARFISLVHLLKEGLHVYGDTAGINLFTRENNEVPLMRAEPWDSEMLFWLKAEQPSLNGVESVFTTDYDLLHHHLGHPSKDMQKQTQRHTARLPDVKIPCKMPIYPGCVLGKMSQQPFSSLGKRAAHPLVKIHSDLKSFPIESYHQWKYFISFIDNNTSFAWVQFLCDKASAVSAL